MSDQHTLLFVYGTLLSGERNHGLLLRARLIARAVTAHRYTLIDLGHCPAMLDAGRTAIHGEVYRCDPDTLARVDSLEGHPHFYARGPVTLARGPRGVEGYLLVTPHPGAQPIVSGDWRAHQQEKRDARDPLAAGLRDLARGRPTPRALAALAAARGATPTRPKRRA